MPRRVLLLCAFLLAVAAGATGPAGAVAAPSDAAAYFPLVPGTVWIYRSAASEEVVRRVDGTQVVAGAECRLVETVIAGVATEGECYRVEADGVYTVMRAHAGGRVVLDPPQRLLASPVAVGKVWRWSGRVEQRPILFEYTWARRETVRTAVGTFDAMQLYFSGAPGPQVRIRSWRWFVRGVGMVKEDTHLVQGARQVRVYLELVRMVGGR